MKKKKMSRKEIGTWLEVFPELKDELKGMEQLSKDETMERLEELYTLVECSKCGKKVNSFILKDHLDEHLQEEMKRKKGLEILEETWKKEKLEKLSKEKRRQEEEILEKEERIKLVKRIRIVLFPMLKALEQLPDYDPKELLTLSSEEIENLISTKREEMEDLMTCQFLEAQKEEEEEKKK